jgi:malate dehydrogenase (oxaloacetate-decarboxylating)(NADP+)
MTEKNDGRGKRPTFTDQEALLFHSQGRPGKLEVVATKPMATQRDLSLAYSPGVAVPVLAIAENESLAYEYTTKGNFVAVITNGTAILGLGNRGALASKPVMEGKAVLFKRFADIDAIDLEVSTEDPEEFINAVKFLGKSWGGINLEDIRAPECFVIEQRLRELLDIPVFHDDQHGTATSSRPSWSATVPAPPASPAWNCSRRSGSRPTTSFCATPRVSSIRAAPMA